MASCSAGDNVDLRRRDDRAQRAWEAHNRGAGFFSGAMMTAREDDEMLIETRLPLLREGARFGFLEFGRRAGDLALGMALVTHRLNDGVLRTACADMRDF